MWRNSCCVLPGLNGEIWGRHIFYPSDLGFSPHLFAPEHFRISLIVDSRSSPTVNVRVVSVGPLSEDGEQVGEAPFWPEETLVGPEGRSSRA